MEKGTFETFMQNRFYPALHHSQERAFRNQRIYKGLQWATIIFSMATAILLGSEQFFDWVPIKLMALFISVVVSGLATALSTFGYQEKWTSYNKTCMELEKEHDTYIANSGDYSKIDDKESLFITRISQIINEGIDNMPMRTVPQPSKAFQK